MNEDARDVILDRLKRADWLEKKFGWRSEYVFARDHSNQPSTIVCNGAWKKALDRAGLPQGICFHTLRHTFASWHMEKETPEMVIVKLGGWSGTEMLKRYVHIKDAQKRKAVQSFEGMVRRPHYVRSD